MGARVIGRMPIIPGYTDGEENVASIIASLCDLGIDRVDVLPFHQLGEGKYESTGRAYACAGMRQLTADDVASVVRTCELAGLKVVVSGE